MSMLLHFFPRCCCSMLQQLGNCFPFFFVMLMLYMMLLLHCITRDWCSLLLLLANCCPIFGDVLALDVAGLLVTRCCCSILRQSGNCCLFFFMLLFCMMMLLHCITQGCCSLSLLLANCFPIFGDVFALDVAGSSCFP